MGNWYFRIILNNYRLAFVTFLGLDEEEGAGGSSAIGWSKSGVSSSVSLISSKRCSGFELACDFVFNRCVGAGVEASGLLMLLSSGTGFRGTIFSIFWGSFKLQCSSYVCFLCFPLQVGHVISGVAAKLWEGLCPHIARNMTSSTGWLLVATDIAYRFNPKTGQVRNSPAGVCSIFILKLRICSTETRIGTRPLSRISTEVLIQPVGCFGFLRWITNFSLTCEDSPFANENLLWLASLVNLIKWENEWFWHALTSRSIANLDPIARVHPESRIT